MIYYRNDVRASGVDGRALVATAKKLLAAVDERGSSLSLTLVDDAAIRDVNREHRGKADEGAPSNPAHSNWDHCVSCKLLKEACS